jgi:hypothetical protein
MAFEYAEARLKSVSLASGPTGNGFTMESPLSIDAIDGRKKRVIGWSTDLPWLDIASKCECPFKQGPDKLSMIEILDGSGHRQFLPSTIVGLTVTRHLSPDQAQPFADLQSAIKDLQSLYVDAVTSEESKSRWYFASTASPSTEPSAEAAPFRSDDYTVTITLPPLQTALGRSVSGSSTLKISDFNLPFASFKSDSSGYSDENKKISPAKVVPAKKTGASTQKKGRRVIDTSNSLLSHLFDLASASPFGQVSTQKTVFDESVHRARQIDACNFSVSSALISKVEEVWSKHFYPTSVTAVPYKIKLYDLEGKFSQHKDTPETDLVGTFLIGLTTHEMPNHLHHLQVFSTPVPPSQTWRPAGTTWRSTNGSYCAFYPDVIHSVLPVAQKFGPNYGDQFTRGTLAFKIFLKQPPQHSLTLHNPTVQAIQNAPKPFGILLKHDYTVDCNRGLLKGADAALFQALSSIDKLKVQLMPVLTTLYFTDDASEAYRLDYREYMTNIYPFNESMIQACLASEDDASGALLAIARWPDHLKKLHFITARNWASNVVSHSIDKGAAHTGNDSRPLEQHSVYISAALIILPENQ